MKGCWGTAGACTFRALAGAPTKAGTASTSEGFCGMGVAGTPARALAGANTRAPRALAKNTTRRARRSAQPMIPLASAATDAIPSAHRLLLWRGTDRPARPRPAQGSWATGQDGKGAEKGSPAVACPCPWASQTSKRSAGYRFSLALSGGRVWAWGVNENGQLGNGTTTNSATPVPVSNI